MAASEFLDEKKLKKADLEPQTDVIPSSEQSPYVTKKVTLEPWSIASDENLHPNLV